eukprot:UN02279
MPRISAVLNQSVTVGLSELLYKLYENVYHDVDTQMYSIFLSSLY